MVAIEKFKRGLVVAGSNTQVQYNNSGAFGADANFVWNKTEKWLQAGNGTTNVQIGTSAGKSLTSGTYNTALGVNALALTTTGERNNAFGYNSLTKNTEGNRNNAFGDLTLSENTVGTDNTAMGIYTMQSNTSGCWNTAIGDEALWANTEGDFNTAVGMGAGELNVSGDRNVFLGHFAGLNETTSDNFYVYNGVHYNTTIVEDKSYSLMYGTFNADPLLQTLKINAKVGVQIDPTCDFQVGSNAGDNTLSVSLGGDVRIPSYQSDIAYLTATESGTGNVSLQMRTLNAGTVGNVMMLTNTGFVGIGTTSPNTILDITGSQNVNLGILKLRSLDGDNTGFTLYPNLTAPNASARAWQIAANYYAYGNLDILRSTVSNGYPTTAVMSMNLSGNVGIGITSPLQKLAINDANTLTNSWGNVSVMTTDSQAIDKGGYLTLGGVYTGTTKVPFAGIAGRKTSGVDAATNGYLALSTLRAGAITEGIRLAADGKVGIGTTAPNSLLEVKGNDAAGGIRLTLAASALYYSNIYIDSGIGNLNLTTARYDQDICLLPGGNVGIGTTEPKSKLHVVELPAYANNAAAAAAGLTAGAFYRTGGDPDLVCVVH